jgi:Conjugative transposon protein TcpC
MMVDIERASDLAEYNMNSFEPVTYPKRVRVAGRFVRADAPVFGCNRFRTVSSRRTMEREASTKRTAVPGFSGTETCGGVMVRGPASGNGERSGAYYPGPAELVPPRPAARALYGDRAWNGDRAPDGNDRGWYGETAPYDELDPFLAGVQADGAVAARPAFGPGRRGAGGRWLLWPLRIVLWTALLVIVFRGLTAIVFDRTLAPAGGGGAQAGHAAAGPFPVALAEAYATEFGRVYLGFSPQSLLQREQALQAFVPPSVSAADPNLGWNGVGQVNLQALQVAGTKVEDPQHAVVTLLALISGQLTELGVPVAATGGGLVITGEPAWLPAPPRVLPPATAAPRGLDRVAQGQLMNELPGFFQAYAGSDSAALKRFLAPGASLTGLGGAVTFDSISALSVPPGGGTRQITVTVIWQVSEQPGSATGNLGMASKLEMTYGMSVVDLQSGKWYVKQIGASTEAVRAR